MWKEPFVYGADFLPLTGGAGSAYEDIVFKTSQNIGFELLRTMFQATDDQINVRIINNSTGFDLIHPQGDIRAVSSRAITGMTANTFLPYNFPVPYVIEPGTEFTVSAADKSGSDNYLRWALHGNKIYKDDAPYKNRLRREVHSFTIDSGNLAAYGSVTIPFKFSTSYGFLVSKLTGVSTGTGTIFMQDRTPWMSRDIHFYNMIGNGQYGNKLTSKKWIPESSSLVVRFSDISGSTNRFFITFHGERVFV